MQAGRSPPRVTQRELPTCDNRPSMGPSIIIPLVAVAIIIPVAFTWAKKTFKDGVPTDDADATVPGARLTSNALRDLPQPEWRIVYEIGVDKLGEIEDVLIGPPGIFAVRTSMTPLPVASDARADPQAVAKVAITRGNLDDALLRCAMTSDRLVTIHWGAPVDATAVSVDVFPGLTAVAGRQLSEWTRGLSPTLSAAQVDLAWQTVTTAIGRPDPLR
jgi:hypothetical protein